LLGFATAIRVSSAWLREGEAEGVQLN
jgi:hypothetical protein